MANHFNEDSVKKLLDPEHRMLAHSIGQFFPPGTCFIIAKSNREIKLRNSKVVALALTNYHVEYNYENRAKADIRSYNAKLDCINIIILSIHIQ